jgi:hypothetical protein
MFPIRVLEESECPEFIRLRLEGLQSDPVAFGSSWEEEQSRTPESVAPRLCALKVGDIYIDEEHRVLWLKPALTQASTPRTERGNELPLGELS